MGAERCPRAWRLEPRPWSLASDLLVRAAGLLASGPTGSGLLWEAAPDEAGWTAISPPGGVDLDPLLARSAGLLEAVATPAAPRGPPHPPGWIVYLRSRRRPDARAADRLCGMQSFGTQVHWLAIGNGRLAVRPRWHLGAAADRAAPAVAPWAAWVDRLARAGTVAAAQANRARGRELRFWHSGASPGDRGARLEVRAALAAELLLPPAIARWPSPPAPGRHLAIFGTTGSGKTGALATLAAEQVRAGSGVVVLDLHGDLAVRTLTELCHAERRRLVALDATADPPGPGVALFVDRSPAGQAREAAHAVAALRRLSNERGETFWGHRLERIFDVTLRRVQEEGGTLADLHALLTDPDRREAARLATAIPAVARFFDELPATLRRNPEYLQSAAARLEKVVLDPRLRALLASDPSDALPLTDLLRAGRSVIVRLPVGELGPEAAGFAASLIAGRLYLAMAAAAPLTPAELRQPARYLWVLDEAHLLSPGLLTELFTEGRKFGIAVAIASQYPERLALDLRVAVRASTAGLLLFRTTGAAAAELARWSGLAPEHAERLSALADGTALRLVDGSAPGIVVAPAAPSLEPVNWAATLAQSRGEFGCPQRSALTESDAEAADRSLLLWILARSVSCGSVRGPPGAPHGPEVASLPQGSGERLAALERRGWVERSDGTLRLTPAGERVVGLRTPTGATTESAEHRALLREAFLLLARRGVWMEILRQGRYDTQLPDAHVAQFPTSVLRAEPERLAEELQRRRTSWAWKFFGGRHVHVEAEVSGALRPERIRRGLAKARAAGAFALFLVGDAGRAWRVRAVLGTDVPHRAQVWTLRRAAETRPAGPMGSSAASA